MNVARWIVSALLFALVACSPIDKAPSFDATKLEEGDLIFRQGVGAKSRAVLMADSLGAYSHVGIVARRDSGFEVIHIAPGERLPKDTVDRIKSEALDLFWRRDRAEHGAVYRLRNNASGPAAAQEARRLLAKGLLFDHRYDLNDTTELYCSEMVCYVYRLAGKDVSFGRRSVVNAPLFSGTYIFPSDIYDNDEFQLIYKF